MFKFKTITPVSRNLIFNIFWTLGSFVTEVWNDVIYLAAETKFPNTE
jgi:hypothetical protein